LRSPKPRGGRLRNLSPERRACQPPAPVVHGVFADGSERLFPGQTDSAVVRALITRNGREAMDLSDWTLK
jgi:hypothetical protein